MSTANSSEQNKRFNKGNLLNRLKKYFSVDEEITRLDTDLTEEDKAILRKFKNLD